MRLAGAQAGAVAAAHTSSSAFASYLLVALIALAAVAVGLLTTRATRRRGADTGVGAEPPSAEL